MISPADVTVSGGKGQARPVNSRRENLFLDTGIDDYWEVDPIPVRKVVLREILVIRFSSLGDLCVLGSVLARRTPGDRVTLVTKAAFSPLMADFQGIDQVISLEGSSVRDLIGLARRLSHTAWDEIIDAHGVMRSALLTTLMGRRPHARLAKDTLARLALLGWGRPSAVLDRTMADRFADLFAGPGHTLSEPVTRPLALGTPPAAGTPPVIGLAPGAQWATKRWPPEHFADLLRDLTADGPQAVRIFLGPREADWFPGTPLAALAEQHPAVEIIRDLGLSDVAAHLAACRVLLTNDSGLMHLAEAVGTPVLALFGPTVRAFGYFPRLPQSRVLERDLDCRPCSRNGKRPCFKGDLPCLREIAPDTVLTALRDMTAEAES